jgi:hypothetical protein
MLLPGMTVGRDLDGQYWQTQDRIPPGLSFGI